MSDMTASGAIMSEEIHAAAAAVMADFTSEPQPDAREILPSSGEKSSAGVASSNSIGEHSSRDDSRAQSRDEQVRHTLSHS